MPLAVVPVGSERPALSGAKVLSFDYGEPQPHAAPVDQITIGKGAMPASTEGRQLKRQKIEAPTMERLESYIKETVPDPDDPEFEEKMTDGLGRTYGVAGGKGRGQTSQTASVAGTTMGSLRRTVDQMLKLNAAAVVPKKTQATGGVMSVEQIKDTFNKKVTYIDAISADVPQNLEMVTFECASRLGMDDKEGWTIPAMVPVFYNPFSTGVHCCPPVYAHYKGYFHGEVAGVSLHDGLEAHELTREHPSRRSIALAVGGVVNLSCDATTANDFQVGDDVYIVEGQSATFDRKRSLHAPRYFSKQIPRFRNLRLGRFVDCISKKHGGIRIVLDIGTWEVTRDESRGTDTFIRNLEVATALGGGAGSLEQPYNPDDLYSGIDLAYAVFASSIVKSYNRDPAPAYAHANEMPPEILLKAAKAKALEKSDALFKTRSLVPGYENARAALAGAAADAPNRAALSANYAAKLAQLDRLVDAAFRVFDTYARKGGDVDFRINDSEEQYFIGKAMRNRAQILPSRQEEALPAPELVGEAEPVAEAEEEAAEVAEVGSGIAAGAAAAVEE